MPKYIAMVQLNAQDHYIEPGEEFEIKPEDDVKAKILLEGGWIKPAHPVHIKDVIKLPTEKLADNEQKEKDK